MHRFVFLVTLALALGFHNALAADLESVSRDRFNPEWGVIFTAEDVAAAAAAQKRPEKIEGGWTPADSDIRLLEPQLAPRLASEIARHARSGDTPLYPVDYYRQYVGITKDAKRLVIVNGFHKTFVENETDRAPDFWRHELTGAWDGGCLFFHAAFEAEKQTFAFVLCQRDPLRESLEDQ